MVDYLIKILIKWYIDNDSIEEDTQFPECDRDITNENLEEDNNNSDSEINEVVRFLKIIVKTIFI